MSLGDDQPPPSLPVARGHVGVRSTDLPPGCRAGTVVIIVMAREAARGKRRCLVWEPENELLARVRAAGGEPYPIWGCRLGIHGAELTGELAAKVQTC